MFDRDSEPPMREILQGAYGLPANSDARFASLLDQLRLRLQVTPKSAPIEDLQLEAVEAGAGQPDTGQVDATLQRQTRRSAGGQSVALQLIAAARRVRGR